MPQFDPAPGWSHRDKMKDWLKRQGPTLDTLTKEQRADIIHGRASVEMQDGQPVVKYGD